MSKENLPKISNNVFSLKMCLTHLNEQAILQVQVDCGQLCLLCLFNLSNIRIVGNT